MKISTKFLTAVFIVLLPVMISGCSGNKKGPKIQGDRIPIITTEGDIQVDPVLASVPVSLPRPYVNANWGQPGGNTKNVNHHPALPNSVTRAWKVSIGKGSDKYEKLVSAPVVWNGVIYTIDIKARVSAFNATSGTLLWRTDLDSEIEKSSVAYGGGVSYWGGRIFATTGYGFAVALDAASGREVWRAEIGTPLRGAPTVSQNRVFVNTQDNRLEALNADTGEVLWEHYALAEDATILGASSPAIDGDTVIAAFSSGEVYALRAPNGQVSWQDSISRTGRLTALATINDIDGQPVIYNNRILVGSQSGRLASLDLRSGERIWETNIGTLYTPWIAGDYMYVVNLEGEVVCMSVRDGRVRWITQLERFEKRKKRKELIRWVGPVLAGDRLIVASSTGYMLSISPYTGEIISGLDIGDGILIPPIVANNTLYVLTDKGELEAYR